MQIVENTFFLNLNYGQLVYYEYNERSAFCEEQVENYHLNTYFYQFRSKSAKCIYNFCFIIHIMDI